MKVAESEPSFKVNKAMLYRPRHDCCSAGRRGHQAPALDNLGHGISLDLSLFDFVILSPVWKVLMIFDSQI